MKGWRSPEFLSAESLHRRIDVRWPGQAAAPALWPHAVRYQDALNQPFQLTVLCLAADAAPEVETLRGRVVAFGLDTGAQQRRWLCGIVSGVAAGDGTGQFATVELSVESALSMLDRRRTCRVFQDRTVPEIVSAILDEHISRNPVIASCFSYQTVLNRGYTPRSYCVQFNESDLRFIDRLLAEEGIAYFFRFEGGSDECSHQLVLTDAGAIAADAPHSLHFRPSGTPASGRQQWISQWQRMSHLIPRSVALASQDYRAGCPLRGRDEAAVAQDSNGRQADRSLSDYQALAPYYADHDRELGTYARLRMQAEEMKAVTFIGEGPPSDLPLATGFVLEDHPAHSHAGQRPRTFITTSTHLELRNNLPEAAQPDCAADEASMDERLAASYGDHLRFTAVAEGTALVPAYADLLDRPTAPGMQTAIVVGPAGEEVYTDELGRIRIRFHWQEPDQHPSDTPEASERSSTWVRVVWPGAGDGFGYQFLPRVGQEVLVAFLHGDIDRPVVIGALHNGRNAPPNFSGQRSLPGNRALAGIQSREHGGEGYGELLMDNTPGEVRTRLAASPFSSELNLGHLSTPRRDGHADPRGEGAELRTDAALALRAAHGVLVSSYARQMASGEQLDRQELLALLDDCTQLFRGLGEAAAARGASACEDEGMAELVRALREWPDANAPGEGAPLVAVAAEGGLVSATPASQLQYAGRNHDVVATDDVQSSSGGHTRLMAGRGLSLYAQDEHLQVIANHGNVVLQAQQADLQARAENNLLLAAGEGEVVISAPRIRLVADDGSYLTLGGGIELGTDGAAVVHAARHDWLGAKTESADTPAFAREPASRQLRFHYEGDLQAVAAGVQHSLSLDDGDTVQGTADAEGLGEAVQRDGMQRVQIQARQKIEDAQGETDG